MSEHQYHIVMQTPLGKKYGLLFADIDGSSLSGWLEILEHRERFDGTVDNNGNCKIKGKIVTLTRTVTFYATGKITESAVFLQIDDGRNLLELTGVSAKEREKA